jgi:aminoglycoside-2''-adenylyltransferase
MPEVYGPAEGDWRPLQPHDVASLLVDTNVPWWVAGGWALDLFLGFQTRPHGDLDVGILRRDAARIIAGLPGWELFEATAGMLYRLDRNERPRAEVNSLWCRPCNAHGWSLELMLDEADGDEWVFRRLPTIRMPFARAIGHTADGIPYLTPEIQLLYKSKRPQAKDQNDFERVLERLGDDQRVWLYDALSMVDPGHAWLMKLPRTRCR